MNIILYATLKVDDISTAGFAVVQYIRCVTELIKRILAGHNVKVAQKPFQTLGHIFSKPNDHLPREQWTDSVYSIPCKDCEHIFIRQTKCRFGRCLKEHQKVVFIGEKKM